MQGRQSPTRYRDGMPRPRSRTAGGRDLVLDARALNRATLSRQHLLARSPLSIQEEIEHLVGMQSQVPAAPYVGLWTRLPDFDPHALGRSMIERQTVRMTLMRGTIHLVTARDALTIRPLFQGMLERLFHHGAPFGRQLHGLDVDTVVAEGRRLVEERPLTVGELSGTLAGLWPGRDATALAYAVRYLLPVVQVTPRGVWGATGQPTLTTLEAWLGRPLEPQPSMDEMVLRYFAGYGPASVMDVQSWSGLRRLGEVVERLRPRLTTFRDDTGRELFDLPDAPRPDPETPAPLRFLPEYDNVLLGYADRRRFVPDAARTRVFASDLTFGSFLVDGVLAGAWRSEVSGGIAALKVFPSIPIGRAQRTEISDEAERLVRFARPRAAHHDVLFVETP
jgi:hypothetical protein